MAPSRQSMDLVNQEGARERHGVMVLVTPLVTRYSSPQRLIASPASCPSAARAGHSEVSLALFQELSRAPVTARLGERGRGLHNPRHVRDGSQKLKEELLHA